ncbi:hypothetical protein C3R44_22240 [Mycobacterium tuberculosis]|nr:hypothetical protein C3R44_22240 [Mycobacterium tuberculosis]
MARGRAREDAPRRARGRAAQAARGGTTEQRAQGQGAAQPRAGTGRQAGQGGDDGNQRAATTSADPDQPVL